MSLNAATIEILIAKGLSAADLLEVARATEVKADRTNAERQARYRARKRNAVTVTDAPPYDNISTPSDTPVDANASTAPRGRADRATRLPDDFQVPAEWIDYAVGKRGWSRADATEEAEGFCRYWQAKGGAGARKRDWFKTWQNWVANSRRPNGTSATSAKPSKEPETLEELQRAVRLADDKGWNGAPWDRYRRKLAEMRRESTGPPRPIGQLARVGLEAWDGQA